MAKSRRPSPISIEIPQLPLTRRRKRPVPRLVVEISEGSASLARCPFDCLDLEIHDYDVPDDWDGPDDRDGPEIDQEMMPGVSVSVKIDTSGRRYQCIKFIRRPKVKKS